MSKKDRGYNEAIILAYKLYYKYVENISFTDFEILFINKKLNTNL